MPPVCCRCNASGRCKNCSCRKANKLCSNCLPCRKGHCDNLPVTEADPENTPTSETRLVETNSEDCDKVPVETTQPMSLVTTSIPETQDFNHSATFHSTELRSPQRHWSQTETIYPWAGFPHFLLPQNQPSAGESSTAKHSVVL